MEIPIRLLLLGIRDHLAVVITHELVVHLPEIARPRAAPGQFLALQVVMIHDIDVIVEMPTSTIGVSDDELAGAVHPFFKPRSKLMHSLDVLGAIHIELLKEKFWV